MNSQTTFLITSILAFALLANVNVSVPVFATGGLDDEEEEEAIEQLQTQVNEINNSLEAISLNLTSGPNNIQANCPDVEEIVQEVVENITTPEVQNNVTEQPITCPIVEEPEQNNQTVIPPVEEQQPVEQNVTEGCQPIPEPEPEVQNETSELEPIICPVNGEILGYTNTTSGEQLPISAGNETIPFLPPIEIPVVEEEPEVEQNNQTVTTPQEPNCNNVTEQQIAPTIINNGTLQDEQEIATIEFEASCGCFVVDKSPEEVQ